MSKKSTSGLDFGLKIEETGKRSPETASKRPKSKSSRVQKSRLLDRLSDTKGKPLSILRSIVGEPGTKQDVIDRGAAKRSLVFEWVDNLEEMGYIEESDGGRFSGTAKGKELVRRLSSAPVATSPPNLDSARAGTQEDKAAHRISVEQKGEREIIKTKVEIEKLDQLRAKRPGDLDEQFKEERLRKLRLANDKAENAERERERRRKRRIQREIEHERAPVGVARVVVLCHEPDLPGPWSQWRSKAPEGFNAPPSDDIETVYYAVVDYLETFGDKRYEYRIQLYDEFGSLLNRAAPLDFQGHEEDVIIPAQEDDLDRSIRRKGERIRELEMLMDRKKGR